MDTCAAASTTAYSSRSKRPKGPLLKSGKVTNDSWRLVQGPCSRKAKPAAGCTGKQGTGYGGGKQQFKEEGCNLRSSQSGPSRVAQLKPWRIEPLTVLSSFLSTCSTSYTLATVITRGKKTGRDKPLTGEYRPARCWGPSHPDRMPIYSSRPTGPSHTSPQRTWPSFVQDP